MPLTMTELNKDYTIAKITGRDKTKKHLESLGFVVGAPVKLVSRLNGDVIINIRDSRIALNEEMARRIHI